MTIRELRELNLIHDEVVIYDATADLYDNGTLYFGSLDSSDIDHWLDRSVERITAMQVIGKGYWGYNVALWILPVE